MKKALFPLFSALMLSLLMAACNQIGEPDQDLSGEEIATELAQAPSADGSFIVDGTKQDAVTGLAEDIDHDSVDDASDNCPTVSNQDQADEDGDGIGNACANL